MSGDRFPASVFARGTEPDARFSLANERTFLAWISTGLALVSVGVGLEALAGNLHPGLRLAASVILVLAGTACPVQAWFGWTHVEAALRERSPLPASRMLPLLTVTLGVSGLLVALGILIP